MDEILIGNIIAIFGLFLVVVCGGIIDGENDNVDKAGKFGFAIGMFMLAAGFVAAIRFIVVNST